MVEIDTIRGGTQSNIDKDLFFKFTDFMGCKLYNYYILLFIYLLPQTTTITSIILGVAKNVLPIDAFKQMK